MKPSHLIVGIIISITTGCASIQKGAYGQNQMPPEDDRKELVKQFADLNPEQREKFIAGEPWIGMSQAQLDALFGGSPGRTQRKLGKAGMQDINLYAERVGTWKTGVVTKYYRATMTNGKLSDFQELDNFVGGFDKL